MKTVRIEHPNYLCIKITKLKREPLLMINNFILCADFAIPSARSAQFGAMSDYHMLRIVAFLFYDKYNPVLNGEWLDLFSNTAGTVSSVWFSFISFRKLCNVLTIRQSRNEVKMKQWYSNLILCINTVCDVILVITCNIPLKDEYSWKSIPCTGIINYWEFMNYLIAKCV